MSPKSRIRIKEWITEPNPLGMVKIEEIVDVPIREEDLDLEQQVTFKHINSLVQEVVGFSENPLIATMAAALRRLHNVHDFINHGLNVYSLIDKVVDPAIASSRSIEIVQDILSETDLTERLQKLCSAFLNVKERFEILAKLDRRAQAEYHEKTQEKETVGTTKPGEEGKQGDFKEKVKGMVDERLNDIKRFKGMLESKKVPANVQKKFDEEVNRYISMDTHHPESTVIRTYLDILSSLPWGVTTEDSIDTAKAKNILDEGHYGMDDIKQRILEFLAVGKLRGKVQGKILCFVGPPGVGKTSIGESIAKY